MSPYTRAFPRWRVKQNIRIPESIPHGYRILGSPPLASSIGRSWSSSKGIWHVIQSSPELSAQTQLARPKPSLDGKGQASYLILEISLKLRSKARNRALGTLWLTKDHIARQGSLQARVPTGSAKGIGGTEIEDLIVDMMFENHTLGTTD